MCVVGLVCIWVYVCVCACVRICMGGCYIITSALLSVCCKEITIHTTIASGVCVTLIRVAVLYASCNMIYNTIYHAKYTYMETF